jgi:uncharacterized protein (TIGR02147 family)
MSLEKQRDFREHLKRELESRIEKNPKYGLRAFSKHLDIDSSRLSKILKGQRPLSLPLVESLGQRLGLSQKQIEVFQKHARTPYQKKTAVQDELPIDDCYQLRMDQLTLISEWQHYAILELMKHPHFEPNLSWVSEHLHQPLEVIAMAVERLKRVGLLEVTSDGSWKDISAGFSTHILGESLTSRAHRHYQTQILDLSKEALQLVPVIERDHSTIAVASSPAKLLEAKKKIRKFRRELAEFMEDTLEKTEVYHLNIGLFPIPFSKRSHDV